MLRSFTARFFSSAKTAAPNDLVAMKRTVLPTGSIQEFFEADGTWIWNAKRIPTGRPWTAAQLRLKSFEDLHCLWWVCIKEMNKLKSQEHEAQTFKVLFPHTERRQIVRKTMAHIKQVLGERRLSYEKALEIKEREQKRLELIDDYCKTNNLPEGSDIPEHVMRRITVDVMKTVPAPVLGLRAGIAAMGMKPYQDNLYPLPPHRRRRKIQQDRKEVARHNAEFFAA